MRLLLTEFKKLTAARLLPILFVVLLVINFLLTLDSARPYPWEDTVRRIWDEYIAAPEEYDEYYRSLEQIGKDNPKVEPEFPVTYDPDGEYNDYAILRHVMKRAEYLESFSDAIAGRISVAKRRIDDLHSLGYSDNTGTTRKVIAELDAYQVVLDTVELPQTWASGYDTYLQNDLVCAFILLFLTLAATQIFRYDHTIGFGQILRTLRHGRTGTALAKLGCLAITVLVTVLLFLGTTLLAVGISEGFSSLSEPIQTFEAFTTVPEVISVGGFLLRQTIFRLAAFLLYSVFVAAIATLGGGWPVSLGGGLLFAALNCYLFYRRYLGTVPPIRYLNLASMTEGCAVHLQYHALRFGRTPVKTETVLLAAVLLLTLILSVLVVLRFGARPGKLSIRRSWRGLRPLVERLSSAVIPHRVSLSPLWVFELHKLRPVLVALMLIAILAARVGYLNQTVGSMAQIQEALYYQYIEAYAPLSPDERTAAMRAERKEIDGILDQKDTMLERYLAGEIDSDAYTAYMEEYAGAAKKSPALERLEQYMRYLNRKSGENPVAPIYDTGWEVYFNLSPDLFLCCAIVLFCAPIFSLEYRSTSSAGGFAQILRTTRRGRRNTFAAKFLLAFVVSGVLALLFRGVTLWRVAENYILDDLEVQLWRLQSFSAVSGELTIGGALLCDFALQLLTGLLLAGLTVALSALCRNLPAVLSLELVLVGLPYLIGSTAVSAIRGLSLPELTAPTTLICRIAAQSGVVGALFFHAALTAALILWAGKRFIRR